MFKQQKVQNSKIITLKTIIELIVKKDLKIKINNIKNC